MADTNVGPGAAYHGISKIAGVTYVCKDNPATAVFNTGQVQVSFKGGWPAVGVCFGSFFVVSGNTLQCRDAVAYGNVTQGSMQTLLVTLNFQAGDYIGVYMVGGGTNAGMDYFYAGHVYGTWSKAAANICVIGASALFTLSADYHVSLYGIAALGQPYISRVQGIPGMRTFSQLGHGGM